MKLCKMFRQTCLRIFPKLFLQNITVSFSSVSVLLKVRLMEDLRNLRGCNSANSLLGELIYAKNIFVIPGTEPPPFFPKYKMDAYSNIQRIQHILQDEQPDYILIDAIWVALHKSRISMKGTTDASFKNKLMSLFMNIRDFAVDYDLNELKSKEFLKHILSEMECIISSCKYQSLYFRYRKSYPPGGLGLFQYVLLRIRVWIATELLLSIYQVGRAQLSFSEFEKRKYGTLLVDTIEPVYYTIIARQTELFHSSWLQMRSALQFYRDIFAKFPAGDKMLLENFYMDKVNLSIQMLDETITSWCDDVADAIVEDELGYLDCLGCEDDKDLEEAGAAEMPKSHTWWAECSTLLKEVKKFRMSQN